MNTFKRITMAAIAAIALAVAGAATAQEAAPARHADPNYELGVSAAVQLQTAQMQFSAIKAGAVAAAIKSCAEFKSELAQVMCAGFATGAFGGGGSGAPHVSALQLPAPPPPEQIKVEQGNWMQALVNAPAALFEGAVKVAPMVVQYLLGKSQGESNTKIALAQSAERAGLYQVFGGINRDAVNAMSSVATQGFITIGQVPQGPTTTYNVTGSNGIGFGSGSVTFNPVTNSYNPVNPAPRVCSGTGTAFTCQ